MPNQRFGQKEQPQKPQKVEMYYWKNKGQLNLKKNPRFSGQRDSNKTSNV